MAWSTEGSLGSLAVQIPLLGRQIALRHVSTPGATPPAAPPKGEPVPVRCNPKEVWRQWMSGFLKPATDWRIAPRELMLDELEVRFSHLRRPCLGGHRRAHSAGFPAFFAASWLAPTSAVPRAVLHGHRCPNEWWYLRLDAATCPAYRGE